jgi:glycosyltransferase involved in cell wall biosynthesis
VSTSQARRPSIFGVLMTRNEIDLLRVNILHHLQTACDRIIVVDNGSTDGSQTVLKRLAKKLPIDWTVDNGSLRQGEIVTQMAHEARKQGADWVIPLDTDEFWHASRQLREVVAESNAGAIEVPRIEFIQARDQNRSSSRALLRMTRRVEQPLEGQEPIDEFLAVRRSMFETMPQPKVMVRATPDLDIPRGGHTAHGLGGPVEVASELVIFHAPVRSRTALWRRAEQGRRVAEISSNPDVSYQNRYWETMRAANRLQEAWRAHSYENGALEVGGREVELKEDGRLVELLSPWILGVRAEAAARLTGRGW